MINFIPKNLSIEQVLIAGALLLGGLFIYKKFIKEKEIEVVPVSPAKPNAMISPIPAPHPIAGDQDAPYPMPGVPRLSYYAHGGYY